MQSSTNSTSLPKEQNDMPKAAAGDRRLRLEGGENLYRAAIATGVRRYLQQSSGFFLKATDGTLADESSPFDLNAGPRRSSQRPNVRRNRAAPLQFQCHPGRSTALWILLRTQNLVPPGESAANMVVRQEIPVVGKGQGISSFVHIHDAALATVAALTSRAGHL